MPCGLLHTLAPAPPTHSGELAYVTQPGPATLCASPHITSPLSNPSCAFCVLPPFSSKSDLGSGGQECGKLRACVPGATGALAQGGVSGHSCVSSQGCCWEGSKLAKQITPGCAIPLSSSSSQKECLFQPHVSEQSLIPSISGISQQLWDPAAPALALVSLWPQYHFSFSIKGPFLFPPCLWPSPFSFL